MKSLHATSMRTRYRRIVGFFGISFCTICAVVAAGIFLVVLGYLLLKGFGSIHWNTFTDSATPMGTPGGGLKNAIVGTLVLILIASAIGVPIGLMGGIYQVESNNKFSSLVRFMNDILNSIPSIVIGLFVYSIVVIPIAQHNPGQGFSALAGGIALALIMIPIVMTTTAEILKMVPTSLKEGSLALGASRGRTMWKVILPAARGGLITGVLLAIARVAGETAPLLFTAFGNVFFSVRLDKPIDSLALSIFQNATSPYDYLHNEAMAGSLMLVGLIFVLSLATRFALRTRRTY